MTRYRRKQQLEAFWRGYAKGLLFLYSAAFAALFIKIVN
jgi:hypothetical protein